jgi:hypothetical protein
VSRSRAALAAALALAATGSAGCQVAYIPGDERRAVDEADPASLRRAVRVLPSQCTADQARAVVSNRSEETLDVAIEVAWSTAQGDSVTADAEVTVGPNEEQELTVPAPAGATADIGCQASKRDVTVHR